ncbi:MAG TPA: cytochrome c biogenesis protein CcsA [Burkholderiales bacterium]|nr:cytochrome c biogenesis protein CcsA [Burkholderiales bacterium]
MPDIVIHALAAAGYAGLAWHFWNSRWRARSAGGAAPGGGLRPWERAAILAALALHGWLLHAVLFAGALRFGFAHALSAMLWLAVLFYWAESLFYNLEGMQAPALALAALAVPLPALFPGLASGAYADSLEFRLHLVLAMLAYSLFTIAILHALLMAVVERRLHQTRQARGAGGALLADGVAMLQGPLGALPPLLTLERLLFRLIAAAFVLLTCTLATGFAFADALFGRPLRFDHKTLFALLSWATFALLLAGRHFRGWRGRTALRWTLSGFAMLLLAYVGSRFVMEVLLGRS